jgi:hypothetical protein
VKQLESFQGDAGDGARRRLSGVRGPTTSRTLGDLLPSKASVEKERRRAIGKFLSSSSTSIYRRTGLEFLRLWCSFLYSLDVFSAVSSQKKITTVDGNLGINDVGCTQEGFA